MSESNDWQVHKGLANKIFDNYEYVTVADKGKYQATEEKSVELAQPISILLNKQEAKEVRNVLHLSRKQGQFGIWHVMLNDESIYAARVNVKEK